MQILGLALWLLPFLLLARIINYIAKRPVMNPWLWFGSSYVVLYVAGLIYGFATNAPNIAYLAGYYFPITAIAAAVGLFAGRRWRNDHPKSSPSDVSKEPHETAKQYE